MRSISLALLLLLPLAVVAAELECRVVKIVDGDTVYILDANREQHKIRLSGIDTPERKQLFGRKAKEYLSGLIAGEQVRVEWDKRDRYGRIIGKVLHGAHDVNLEMVEMGLAWWYRKYSREQPPEDRILYEAAEDRVRAAGPVGRPRPDTTLGVAPALMANMQPVEDVEAEVQARFPHHRLHRSSYEGKGLPASWRCTLHRRDFRAKASDLIRPASIGCPDCIEERAYQKRKQKRADTNLEQHLEVIQQYCGVGFARTYRMHAEGVKWDEIGSEFEISNQGVGARLRKIKAVLSEAARQTTEAT